MNDVKVERGDIFYISTINPNEVVGSETRPGRPMLVISNDVGNRTAPTVEVVPLTLQDKPDMPTHVYIDNGKCRGSTILCEQIKTFSKERLGEYWCHLDSYNMDKVDVALAVSIGIKKYIDAMGELRIKVRELTTKIKELESHDPIEEFKTPPQEESFEAIEGQIYKRMYYDIIDKLTRR